VGELRKATRSALEAAAEQQPDEGIVGDLVEVLLRVGLDGVGPLPSAIELAERARAKSPTTEAAIKRVRRRATTGGGVGGFVTGVGGFMTMPVALPANVIEFYVQATRLVGAIATLRGYDVTEPRVRTAVLLTLVGANAEEVLTKAGLDSSTGRVTSYALQGAPPVALMVVNKAVGFRLLESIATKLLGKLGRGLPLAGGFIGGGFDAFMMNRIAQQALEEFPRQDGKVPASVS
jgi:EcsC protein family